GLRQAMPGPNGMRHFEQSLAAVANLPVSMEARQDLLLLVDDFVFGHMLRTMAFREMPALGADAMAALRSFGEAQLATGAYPHIAAMVEAAGPDAFPTLDTVDQRFEAGLATIRDGAAKRLGLE
ncbi:MAG: TetR/AcrR family transcriptional regulator C-terminal domain-containing protein, partial [Bauldia sp.]